MVVPNGATRLRCILLQQCKRSKPLGGAATEKLFVLHVVMSDAMLLPYLVMEFPYQTVSLVWSTLLYIEFYVTTVCMLSLVTEYP